MPEIAKPRPRPDGVSEGFGAAAWVVGEAELDDAPGVRLLARMIDDADAPLETGAPVTVSFVDVAEGVALPTLKLPTA